MLSNTATPIYYGEYRDRVLRGDIVVNREVALEMARIDELIADPEMFYDDDAVEGFIAFCENELTLTDGRDLELLLTFKVWAEQIFGWWYFEERQVYEPTPDNHGGRWVTRMVKHRLTKKQYLIVARGAAKSMYVSCLQAYYLVVDTSTTQQVTTAPTMKQAEEVMSAIRTAITRAPGPLFQFLTAGSVHNTTGNRAGRQQLVATKKGIENFLTGSLMEVRPMSIAKLQGSRAKIATVDEWLSGDIREDVVSALEQSASKHQDYLIAAISSEGTVRNGPGDSIKLELLDILNGKVRAPHVSIWYYKLDDVSEVGNPDMWPKANPNLGLTISYDAYHKDVERAENVPSARNDILAKRFGLPMEGLTYFFTYEETLPTANRLDVRDMSCAVGADLSHGDDFCAFTLLFPLQGGTFGVKTRSYITDKTLSKLPPALRLKYNEFIDEGTLFIFEGSILDMNDVYDELERWAEKNRYDMTVLWYDPYNAREFVERWTRENGPYGVHKVIQGSRTESVPLGELKSLASEKLLIFDSALLTYTMGNAVTMEDTNGNRKLVKRRNEEKVDNVSALMDAFVAYKLFKEAFE